MKATDGAIHFVIQPSLLQLMLMVSHHLSIAGHPGQQRMHDTLHRNFYWLHTTADVIQIVNTCPRSARNNFSSAIGINSSSSQPLSSWTLVAMDVVGPFPKTVEDSESIFITHDRYFKLTKAISTSKTKATPIAIIFHNHWLTPYIIPTYILTDNGTPLVSKSVASMCAFFGIKHLTATAYHTRTNGQVERLNKTIYIRFRLYAAEYQTRWFTFL